MTYKKSFLLHYQLLNVHAVDVAANIEMKKLLFLKLNERELGPNKIYPFERFDIK